MSMKAKAKAKVPEAKNNGDVANKSAVASREERRRRGRTILEEMRRRAVERREASEANKEPATHSCGEATSNCAACRQVASEVEADDSRTPVVEVFVEEAPAKMGVRVVEDRECSAATNHPIVPLDDLTNKGASKNVVDRGDSSSAEKDEASRGGAPSVVVASTASISLRYHHEALLRASASCVIDAVVAEEAAYEIFRAYANRKELGEGDASPFEKGYIFGNVLRRRLDYARQREADEGFALSIVAKLVAALMVVESRADLFARDYASASQELGALAAHDIVKAMDKDYRKLGGDDYHYRLGLWGKFLGLVASRGVVVELLGYGVAS